MTFTALNPITIRPITLSEANNRSEKKLTDRKKTLAKSFLKTWGETAADTLQGLIVDLIIAYTSSRGDSADQNERIREARENIPVILDGIEAQAFRALRILDDILQHME